MIYAGHNLLCPLQTTTKQSHFLYYFYQAPLSYQHEEEGDRRASCDFLHHPYTVYSDQIQWGKQTNFDISGIYYHCYNWSGRYIQLVCTDVVYPKCSGYLCQTVSILLPILRTVIQVTMPATASLCDIIVFLSVSSYVLCSESSKQLHANFYWTWM